MFCYHILQRGIIVYVTAASNLTPIEVHYANSFPVVNHCASWIKDTLSPFNKICPRNHVSRLRWVDDSTKLGSYVPNVLLFSSGFVLVICLTSTASSMTRFMNSSKP